MYLCTFVLDLNNSKHTNDLNSQRVKAAPFYAYLQLAKYLHMNLFQRSFGSGGGAKRTRGGLRMENDVLFGILADRCWLSIGS